MRYKLTDNTVVHNDITLYQIEAITNFNGVEKGTLGGYIQSTDNLSDNGWVGDNAKVFGNARVYGNAWVRGDAKVYGDARVFGNAKVFGDARVSGEAWVYGNAQVFGNAEVYGYAQVLGNAKVFGNVIATRRVFHVYSVYNLTMTDNHISYGCIQKTIDEWKEFLKSDEVIETPRESNKFKHIQNTLEFVIRKHELD